MIAREPTLMLVDGPAEVEATLPLQRVRDHLAMIAGRDLYDPEHIEAVAVLSVRLAVRLGLDGAALQEVEVLARLRDVGKAMVPITVLRKQGPLDEAEWALLRRHPEYGATLVAQTPGWEHLAGSVRAANERWDGAGYPDGLAGEAIPPASRITFLAQAYLAMRADRPYRPALSLAEAIVEVAAGRGTQFCPRAVGALVEELLADAAEPTVETPAPAPESDEPAPPVRAPAPVRASVASPAPAPASRGALTHRIVASAGALAGTLVGLAIALPLPDAAHKCPPASEGRGMCQMQSIYAPAATIVGVCAAVGMALLVWLVLRLPEFVARHRRGEFKPRPSAPAFSSDPTLAAATWGVVYDDDDTALRYVGRRRWRRPD